jgi:hypothetical protein
MLVVKVKFLSLHCLNEIVLESNFLPPLYSVDLLVDIKIRQAGNNGIFPVFCGYCSTTSRTARVPGRILSPAYLTNPFDEYSNYAKCEMERSERKQRRSISTLSHGMCAELQWRKREHTRNSSCLKLSLQS